MALYGAFSSSMLGMMSQSRSLQNIGTNIANVNTGGYKRTDTQFATVLSSRLFNVSDIGGVRPLDRPTVAQQGNIVSSTSATDVAISGTGFFVLNSEVDGSGIDLYTRDGSFEIAGVNDISVTGNGGTNITVKDGYLVDKNGYFIQGWAYSNGTVSASGDPQSLRVDQYAFIGQFEPTTSASLNLNLPSGDDVGDSHVYDFTVVDSAGTKQAAKLNFAKTGINTWDVSTTTSRTPVAQVDTVTLTATGGVDVGDVYSITVSGGTTVSYTAVAGDTIDTVRDNLVTAMNANSSNNALVTAAAGATGELTLTAVTAGSAFTISTNATNAGANPNTISSATTTANVTNTQTTATTSMTFGSDGSVTTPSSLTLALSFAGGSTASVALDTSDLTQFAGDFLPTSYTRDGYASANMSSFSFDSNGNVIGTFDDGSYRNIYQLSLGVFSNPNALEARNGNVYAQSPDSGEVLLTTGGATGYASFSPNARELSNVDIADEFTKMMMTQTAYNASSTVFKTTDEMTTVARDLKR